jgi:hypothetical protein
LNNGKTVLDCIIVQLDDEKKNGSKWRFQRCSKGIETRTELNLNEEKEKKEIKQKLQSRKDFPFKLVYSSSKLLDGVSKSKLLLS